MQKPLRLGASTSSFLHMMPHEAIQAMISTSQKGVLRMLDARENALMVDYTRRMIQAIDASEITTLECYHAQIWDCDAVLEPILACKNLEFWSVHAPYGRLFDPSCPYAEGRESAVKAYCEAADIAVKLGAKVVVSHPGANAQYEGVTKEERLQFIPDVIRRIADYAGERGVSLAVEPLPKEEAGNRLEEVLWVLEKVDRTNVGVNFDVNHLFPPEAIPDLIRKAGDRIFSVHISDQDGVERHWLPFEGKLNWAAVISALGDAGYQGPLIYETHIRNAGSCEELASIIVENYKRLIALRT